MRATKIVAGVAQPACAEHAHGPIEIALVSDSTLENQHDRRRSPRRSASTERRAYWRPTPDRRREDQEHGRRGDD
ncbi:MAG: hypothetical protein ACHREM_27385 [Polyangiales bacterium]